MNSMQTAATAANDAANDEMVTMDRRLSLTMMKNRLHAHYNESDIVSELNEDDIQRLYETLFCPDQTYTDNEMENLFKLSDLLPDDEYDDISGGVTGMNVRHLKYVDLLDYALEWKRDALLQLMRWDHMLSNNILWFVYARRNEFMRGTTEADYPTYYDTLDELLIADCVCDEQKLASLISMAINGRRLFITYKPREFHTYNTPRLLLVQKLVPKYITAEKALDIWEKYDANTYSMSGMGSEEAYPFEKDMEIFDWLTSVNNFPTF